MAYAAAERGRNTFSGALSTGLTGAGIGTAIAPGIGTAIGGGIGLIVGGVSGFFLTDNEKNQVIEAYRRGELSEETIRQIEGTIARRYEMLRRSQGADFSRRGTGESSFAMRQIADTYNAERDSLADALVGESQRLQAIGFGMSDSAAAGRAQSVASGVGALFEGYQAYQEGEAMKADAASRDRLATMLGKYLEDQGADVPMVATKGKNPFGTKLSTSWNPGTPSKTQGAGNPFSRHRTRQPNVTIAWDALKKQRM